MRKNSKSEAQPIIHDTSQLKHLRQPFRLTKPASTLHLLRRRRTRPPDCLSAFLKNHGLRAPRHDIPRDRERADISLHQSDQPSPSLALLPRFSRRVADRHGAKQIGISNIHRQERSVYRLPMDRHGSVAADVYGADLSRPRLVHWCVCQAAVLQHSARAGKWEN